MSGQRKTLVGRVVSDKMQNTVVVAVETLKHHRVYGKTLRSVKRYMAHDAKGDSHSGDLVRIEESRPLSSLKRWAVVEIVERAR